MAKYGENKTRPKTNRQTKKRQMDKNKNNNKKKNNTQYTHTMEDQQDYTEQ